MMMSKQMIRTDGGFSLLEILLVLVLLTGGCLALILHLPHLTERQQLTLATTRVVEDLREARFAAMSENTYYTVNFYSDANVYHVLREGKVIRVANLPPGVEYFNAPSPSSVLFKANGEAQQGTTVMLRMKGQNRRSQVIIAPIGGRIRVENL
ncbi:MAG: GspH/FimT family protein [Peptococcaceae bacterium]|jgi:Tfp pilus assembly protein FimT|nr:GspH/FimT family protein [Peptococcaceae bacterium]